MEFFLEITKALADETRLRILMLLKEQELCACQIIECFNLSGATISKHLSILKRAKLISSRKDGRWVYYKLDNLKNEIIISSLQLVQKSLKNQVLIEEDEKKLTEVLKIDASELCRIQNEKNCCN
ncbi:MAG: metalloregulator ArsR/SmtB family transcription factor [Cyanobacteriota bacterium]